MLFRISRSDTSKYRQQFQLYSDNWDDFGFKTLFVLEYLDENEIEHQIGSVKIGHSGLNEGRVSIPFEFNKLPDNFFSLGQDASYYSNLNKLGDEWRKAVLESLRDVSYDNLIYQRALSEKVMTTSLLRSVSTTSVEGGFRRLSKGLSELTEFNFKYTSFQKYANGQNSLALSFEVKPYSNPPSNIHVLIGRNGVGKTHLLNNMIQSLLDESNEQYGNFATDEVDTAFANLVSVTFSAFDTTTPLKERQDKSKGISYFYIGLRKIGREDSRIFTKNPDDLEKEFIRSVEACKRESKTERWRSTLSQLESDDIFKQSDILNTINIEPNGTLEKEASRIFNKLSSGHKIVLLTISKLVETIQERSLVLLDEPESHLHPPLLSAFIRALSNLLIQRNGVAIIATHSPVILQEVPRSCVWKLRRKGRNMIAERLEIESFGENVGTLTREVFGLEVEESGFHKLLSQSVENSNSYEEVISSFNSELGIEAKAILRVLFHNKK